MASGNSNANYRIDFGRQRPVLVRLYIRDPRQAEKERILTRHLADCGLPVPRPLYWAATNQVTGDAYAIFEWIEGEALNRVAPLLRNDLLKSLGHSIGAAISNVHRAKTFRSCGFLDNHTAVAEKADVSGAGLIEHLQRCLLLGRGGERLGPELTRATLDLAFMEGDLLDLWDCKPCLVHGDFSASNILVRETNDEWVVSGIVDWEFAFSGKPYFDLGQLLRTWSGERKWFEVGIEQGYSTRGDDSLPLPKYWRRTTRIADLFAWAEFLSRPECTPSTIAAAQSAIVETLINRE